MAGSSDVQCLLFLPDISSFIFLQLGLSATAPYPIYLLYNGLSLFLPTAPGFTCLSFHLSVTATEKNSKCNTF